MMKRTIKYNPAFLSEQELIDSFVVRHKDLELVMQTICENVNSSNQHILITGPRGIGKTMLLLRVAAEVNRSQELSRVWYPLKFAEESYDVSTPGEFWLNAILHLAEQTGKRSWQETWDELNDVSDEDLLREKALAKLMDFADQQDKKLLIIVENLNMLLSDQLSKDDAWKIRHTLQNEPRIMFLASAIKGFEDVEGINRALFDAFITHELQPLDEKQCERMWIETTGKKVTDNRARPIQILTGGSPRLVKIISMFGANLSFRELMTDLTQLVDDHTDYFKSQIESLPPQERKVFVSLAELWDPSSSREVAKLARLPINKASSLLNRLLGRGIVSLLDNEGRTRYYQVAERMFNIYYLMRSRGIKSRRVKAIVNFLIDFYGVTEIVKRTRLIAEEACRLAPEHREDHYLAIEEILNSPVTESMRGKILKEMPREFFTTPKLPESLKNLYLSKELEETAQQLKGLYSSLEEHKGNAKSLKAIEKRLTQAVNDFPDNPINWLKLGYFYSEISKRYDEAEEYYRKAIEIQPENFFYWSYMGALYEFSLKRYVDAAEAYRKAIELNTEFFFVWGQLGQLLHEKLKNYNEAEKAYLKAIELNPDDDQSWAHLGQLLHDELQKYDEAEQAYRKAIELNPEHTWVWANLGQLLHEKLERYGEAENAYRKAIELNPDEVLSYMSYFSLLLAIRETSKEALTFAQKALVKFPDDPSLFNSFSWSVYENRKLELLPEAEQWMERALELSPGDANIKHTYAAILLAGGKVKEALEISKQYLTDSEAVTAKLKDANDLFISFAAYGFGKEALTILEESPNADILEPLVVGLKLFSGEDVKSALEIKEIGNDVVKRIKERKEEIDLSRVSLQ